MKHSYFQSNSAQDVGGFSGSRFPLLCSWENPRALENHLNRLAAKGWELQVADGFFSGKFSPTQRRELRYLVCFASQSVPDEGELCRQGWESVGFCRGLFICKSLSCREPDRENTARVLKLPGQGRGILSAALLLALWLALLLIPGPGWGRRLAISLLGDRWLSSHLGVMLWLLLPAEFTGQAAARLFSLISSLGRGKIFPAQLSGVLDIIFTLLLPCCALPLVLLDLSSSRLLFLFLCLALAAVSFSTALFLRRRTAILPALLVLASVIVGLLFPNMEGSSTSAVSLADWPVLQAADLDESWGSLSYIAYNRSASLLVSAYDYQEFREGGQVQCQVYRCITEGTARYLLAQLGQRDGDSVTLSTLSGEVSLAWNGVSFSAVSLAPCELDFDESWLWTGDSGSLLLLRQGRTVAVISGGADWTEYTLAIKNYLGLR